MPAESTLHNTECVLIRQPLIVVHFLWDDPRLIHAKPESKLITCDGGTELPEPELIRIIPP